MSTEAEKRTHRACFTGHRPEKLVHSERRIKKDLEREIRIALSDGINVFISGMARGTDNWAAEVVLRLRKKESGIKLVCAVPYEGVERDWSADWQRRFNAVLNDADLVRYICPQYSRDCFRLRNEWMVNHSAKVVAVFCGIPGGTKNTIDYAQRHGAPIAYVEG